MLIFGECYANEIAIRLVRRKKAKPDSSVSGLAFLLFLV